MLTDQEKITNYETLLHIRRVNALLNMCVGELLKRAEFHDRSKLERPEVEHFARVTAKLATTTYGSNEYLKFLSELAPALKNHYAENRHHPEHYLNGISDMNLIDLLEMFCDWKAASERHADGNIFKSIEINARRFEMSPQLASIFKNTAESFFR